MEVCDDIVEQMAHEHARALQPEGADELPVQVKSMAIQSCTATEMFFRCSCDYPQVQAGHGLNQKGVAISCSCCMSRYHL